MTADVARILRSEKKAALLITHDISEAISLADRIFVLTARRGRRLGGREADFASAGPLRRREEPRFSGWFERLWKELNP